jgi:preprotein translocase subunit SecD
MFRTLSSRLILITLIALLALWIDTRDQLLIVNPLTEETLLNRDVRPRLGLDLRGGLQVLLEADLPAETRIEPESMQIARDIVEQRTNALGVSENVIQVAGDRRIVGEFPGAEDASAILAIIQQTGLLEFVDMGFEPVPEGSIVETDFGLGTGEPAAPAPTVTPTPGADSTAPGEQPATVYHTLMTGAALQSVSVGQGNRSPFAIHFVLHPEFSQVFEDYTRTHSGQFLAMVLDKQVISVAQINDPIPGGAGLIEGNFTFESSNALAIQLRYGSLPVPLKVVETRIIGPTLGEDSLQKSLLAGVIGMSIVILFMAIYYRLPGGVADISILFYAAITFALFKYFHFTLTLPGIAGFLLSTGAALDANILIFERLKEELRNGKTLAQAVDQGWTRAWSSIRDSNLATIITSLILYWFGSSFGATIVKGFSLTLALGVVISMFTAFFVTRSLLAIAIQIFKPKNLPRWFGI